MKQKKCYKCKKYKTKFQKNKLLKDGLKSYCSDCENKRGKEFRIKNKQKLSKKAKEKYEKHKDLFVHRKLLRVFGVGLDDYKMLLKKQNNKCAICKKRNQQKKRFNIDHDHKTGKIRGLLCMKCNVGLGAFEDNIVFLKESIKYLKKSEKEKSPCFLKR